MAYRCLMWLTWRHAVALNVAHKARFFRIQRSIQITRNMDGRWGALDRPEKPRSFGVTEIRSPYYSVMGPRCVQDMLETTGIYVDGINLAGGTFSLMAMEAVKEITQLAHEHGVYVTSGGWAEHRLLKGRGSFKQYIEDCKNIGFDAIDMSTGLNNLSDNDLLCLIRMVKKFGLKARPELGICFGSGGKDLMGEKDADWIIKRAERCLEAGADMIMIESEGLFERHGDWRTDIVAKIVGRLGIDKTMFEAATPNVYEWYVKNYGSKVNLYVDHSQVLQLECLRSGNWGLSSRCRILI